MRQLTIEIEESRYGLLLQFLQNLETVRVTADEEIVKKVGKGFDFSDLAGKLEWSGDAVAAQRALRDEW